MNWCFIFFFMLSCSTLFFNNSHDACYQVNILPFKLIMGGVYNSVHVTDERRPLFSAGRPLRRPRFSAARQCAASKASVASRRSRGASVASPEASSLII